MDESARQALEFVGASLAAVTGGIHLYLGLPRLFYYARDGRPFTDPRMVLFVLSGVAVLVGVTLWARGLRRDAVYGAGVLLVVGYLVGWVRLGGHGADWAWETGGHSHGSLVATTVEHLFASNYLLATKVVEVTLLAVLVVLLVAERREAHRE